MPAMKRQLPGKWHEAVTANGLRVPPSDAPDHNYAAEPAGETRTDQGNTTVQFGRPLALRYHRAEAAETVAGVPGRASTRPSAAIWPVSHIPVALPPCPRQDTRDHSWKPPGRAGRAGIAPTIDRVLNQLPGRRPLSRVPPSPLGDCACSTPTARNRMTSRRTSLDYAGPIAAVPTRSPDKWPVGHVHALAGRPGLHLTAQEGPRANQEEGASCLTPLLMFDVYPGTVRPVCCPFCNKSTCIIQTPEGWTAPWWLC